jgi:thioredoxin-dependent peroxiredoxin
MMLNVGDDAPKNIELLDQDGKLVKLNDLYGQKLVLYTYPKDDTPGCTTEANNFRDSIKEYEAKGIRIIGISADSVNSHRKFATKYQLPFTLLSDPEKKLLKTLGSLDGTSIKRRTWLIDEQGKIEKVYESVSPSNHNNQLCEYYLLKK